jgi:hypothetical protein
MEVSRRGIYSKGYLTLPSGSHIKVYTQQETGELVFTQQFLKLWYYLFNVGQYLYLGGFAGPPGPGPLNSISRLTGTPIRQPGSVARIQSFRLLNSDGPIVNLVDRPSFELNVFSNALILTIDWEVTNNFGIDDCDLKVGFYTSDNPGYDMTGNLYLICGNLGASLFTGTSGQFICRELQRIYVAVNADVNVKLRIKSYVPKILPFPNLFLEPYTKYLRINTPPSECTEDSVDDYEKLPVYTLTQSLENGVPIYIKKTTPLFYQVAALINAYLAATSLTIILLPDEVLLTKRNILQVEAPQLAAIVYPVEFDTLYIDYTDPIDGTHGEYMVTTIITTNLPNEIRMGNISGNFYLGIRLQPQLNKVPQVTFTCTITPNGNVNIPPSTVIIICVGGSSNPYTWKIWDDVNGIPATYPSGPLIIGEIFSHAFTLKAGVTEFSFQFQLSQALTVGFANPTVSIAYIDIPPI